MSREELRARWVEAHQKYALAPVAELPTEFAQQARRFAAVLSAAASGNAKAVRGWLDDGGSVDARGGGARHTMLMKASAFGRRGIVELLASRGANLNLVDSEGSSALHAAAYMGHIAVVRALIRAGVVVDIKDKDGETAMHWADSQGHQTIVELLRGQTFAPRVLSSVLDQSQIDRLLGLLEYSSVGPVHDDGAGHEVIFLHACAAQGRLSTECVQLLDGLADTMRAYDPRLAAMSKGGGGGGGGGGGEAEEEAEEVAAEEEEGEGIDGVGKGVQAAGEHGGGGGGNASTQLAVRCVELHTYRVGGCLMERDHKDSGSALSMSVCLTPCAAGGKFLTWDGEDGRDVPVVHECRRGDAVLFRSEDYHNVSPVTEGIRQTLVIELWAGATNVVDRNH